MGVVGVLPLSRGSESGCTGIFSILFNGAYHLLEKRKHAPALTLVWKHTVYTAPSSAYVTSVAAFLVFLTYRHTLSLLGAVFCAAVFAAKSHSLSSREVQKPRGRWYVTESRLCTNVYQTGAAKVDFVRVCACEHSWKGLQACIKVYKYMMSGSAVWELIMRMSLFLWNGGRMGKTMQWDAEGRTSDIHMFIWLKPF